MKSKAYLWLFESIRINIEYRNVSSEETPEKKNEINFPVSFRLLLRNFSSKKSFCLAVFCVALENFFYWNFVFLFFHHLRSREKKRDNLKHVHQPRTFFGIICFHETSKSIKAGGFSREMTRT